MVVGAKMTIQHVPSKGRISIMKIQNFTVQKDSVVKVVYGTLLAILALISVIIDPVEIFTNWYLELQEGKFIFRMWENPTYQLVSEVHLFNYSNTEEYLEGTDKTLKLQEIGPFFFQEFRTNENLTIDHERGVMRMRPRITLKFMPEKSVAHYRDVNVVMPNIALIALSTLMADKLGYYANAGAYYSISAMGSKLFKNMSVEDLFWGYSDPMVSIANTLLPGWIDFEKIGILDRFYAQRPERVEVELKDASKRFSINNWNDLEGLPEQGFTDLNTSIPCNRVKGAYEGLMFHPKINKNEIFPIFRKQACRTYPFSFLEEATGQAGFNYYRYQLQDFAFNNNSTYACKCNSNCLPDGFVDISNCFYGFPIALSKPHFVDVDPTQLAHFEGLKPDAEKYNSRFDVEPRCDEAPPEVIKLLRLRFVIAPPLVMTVEILLFIVGVFFAIQGIYRIWKPSYKLIQPKEEPKVRRKSSERRRSSVILNMSDNCAFRDDDELAKEAVSLLAITEEDGDMPDLLFNS